MRNYWSSKFCSTVITFFLMVGTFASHGQFAKQEEKFLNDGEKYLYPIQPGQPGSLAGTMGELRATHFHGGIDIRTNNMTGYAVHASKSGYISRATASAFSYGNALYITHPDGNTTLYAHLDKFSGPVGAHILAEQYKLKSNEIDLFFQPGQFPVKQGEVIALSGNSGSSGGPHLHFEFRDSNNFLLDPLKVGGFSEIVDKLPPAPEKIALRTLDPQSRINDRFGRFEFYGNKVGNNYVIASPILANGTVGIEILAKDRLAYKSPFYGGVNFLEVWVDSVLVFRQSIDKVELAETRAIYTLMDFKTMRNKGTRFYKLYIDDGNDLPFYGTSPSTGKIRVNPNKVTNVKVKMTDSYNNSSTVSFKIKPTPVVTEVTTLEPMTTDVFYDITENTMLIASRNLKEFDTKAKLYVKGEPLEIEPAYFNQNRRVYLVDLRKTLPDSVVVNSNTIVPRLRAAIPPAMEYKFYSDEMDIQFPANALYDTLYLNTDHTVASNGQEIFTVGTRTVPLHKSIDVTVKPVKDYSADKRYAVYRVAGRSYSYVGGEWTSGRLRFSTREFGDFTVLRDTIAPSIRMLSVNNQVARFKIRDDLSGIESFEATLNGEWLLMHYDYKINTIWSERLNKAVPMKGKLALTLTDKAGNKSTFTQNIP